MSAPSASASPIKTRILIISDTHGLVPAPQGQAVLPPGAGGFFFSSSSSDPASRPPFVSAFRHPLPRADVAIHCGDLTKGSAPAEYAATLLALLAPLDAPLKIAIPGNHDAALDPAYWEARRLLGGGGAAAEDRRRRGYPAQVRRTVAAAAAAADGHGGGGGGGGVHVLVEEGSYDFVLANGARLRVYASPWTPEYGGWAFQYAGPHDFEVREGTDVVVTHGPPEGVLDRTFRGEQAGCGCLLEAVARARPRVHCFGHIHEGWGARLRRWKVDGDGVGWDEEREVVVDDLETLEGSWADSVGVREQKVARRNEWAEERARVVDLCSPRRDDGSDEDKSRLPRPFEPGKDTLFVNAAVVDVAYQPRQIPWLVDLELARADADDARRARETAAVIERAAKQAETRAASVAGGPAPVER